MLCTDLENKAKKVLIFKMCVVMATTIKKRHISITQDNYIKILSLQKLEKQMKW